MAAAFAYTKNEDNTAKSMSMITHLQKWG